MQRDLTDEQIMSLALAAGLSHQFIPDDYADAVGIPRGRRHTINDVTPETTLRFARAVESSVRAALVSAPAAGRALDRWTCDRHGVMYRCFAGPYVKFADLEVASHPQAQVMGGYERDRALMEAHREGAADAYFKARHPMLDRLENRRVYEAAYAKAWADQQALSASLAKALQDYVSEDEIAEGHGSGIGGEVKASAIALLEGVAAKFLPPEQEGKS